MDGDEKKTASQPLMESQSQATLHDFFAASPTTVNISLANESAHAEHVSFHHRGFIPPKPGDSRSPCPALNTLANHGYVRRDGNHITFFKLIGEITRVYNMSFPLAFLLAVIGFITCGKISRIPSTSRTSHSAQNESLVVNEPAFINRLTSFCPRWTLDLASLSERGPRNIAHDASLVHLDGVSSTAPDPDLVANLIRHAADIHGPSGKLQNGLNLSDIAQVEADRRASLPSPLSAFHSRIAFGECALAWLILHGSSRREDARESKNEHSRIEDIIPTSRLAQWFGEERLPDGWWDEGGARPARQIALRDVRERAKDVKRLMQAST